MIGLDLWNGNRLQVNAYTQLTGITFPVLMGASVGGNRWGLGLENVLVVDQEGIVRLINDINTLANCSTHTKICHVSHSVSVFVSS